jgi:hypothetical protein
MVSETWSVALAELNPPNNAAAVAAAIIAVSRDRRPII